MSPMTPFVKSMQVLVFLGCFFALSYSHARTCRALLHNPLQSSYAAYMTHPTPEVLQTHAEEVFKHLNHGEVQFIHDEENQFLILPQGDSPLNTFALRLKERFNTDLVYSLSFLKESGATAAYYFDYESQESRPLSYLFLSLDAISSLEPTRSEYHEWAHIIDLRKVTETHQTPTAMTAAWTGSDGSISYLSELRSHFVELQILLSRVKEESALASVFSPEAFWHYRVLKQHASDAFLYAVKSLLVLEGGLPRESHMRLMGSETKHVEFSSYEFRFFPAGDQKFKVQISIPLDEGERFSFFLEQTYSLSNSPAEHVLENHNLAFLFLKQAEDELNQHVVGLADFANLFEESAPTDLEDLYHFAQNYRPALNRLLRPNAAYPALSDSGN